MCKRLPLTIILILALLFGFAQAFDPSGLLEIHYINVGTAGCVFVVGPDGTTLLMDGGDNGNGYADIVPYFQSIGLTTADGLDYMIADHLDSDHCGGLDEVINSGYDVTQAVYYNGSTKWNTIVEDFFNAAATTTGGGPYAMPLGTVLQLGDGATATCVAVGGNILGDGSVSVSEENDKSVVMFIKYGQFEYIYSSDLGGGDDDQWCTGRHTATNYANVETPLSNSLVSPSGANLLGPDGLEVMHIGHHGSESSGNSDYMNNLKPSVACVNVGWGQPDGWDFPRHDVIDNVILAEATACVTADPAMVFQTEEGSGTPDTYRSYSGYAVGDIIIKTNGQMLFQVSGSGRRHGGPDERAAAGLPRYFPLDEDRGDYLAPADIGNLMATGGPGSDEVTLHWTAPGDDGVSGTAAIYEIRYNSAAYGPITNETQWNNATAVTNPPSPQVGGGYENFTVSGLSNGQSYYFAIKTMDDNLNYSGLSNSPMGTAGYVPLLPNGDMEAWDDNGASGPPDYWNVLTSSITASREGTNVHGGTYSTNLTWTSQEQADCEFASDIISVSEGYTYTCSLYVYDNDNAGYISLYYMWNTGNTWGPSTYNSDQANWQLLTYAEVAPAGATSLQVVFRCYDTSANWDGDATAYVDDITLNETFEGDLPPQFGTIYRYPFPVVYPENNVAVRAEIIDDGTVDKDSLYYQTSSLLTYTAVAHDSIGTDNSDYYWYTIPASIAGTFVEYYVIAEDDAAQRSESSVLNYTVSEHPSNALANGDFESWAENGPSGPPDNWTEDTGGFTATQETGMVHGGNYSLNLTWTDTQTQILNSDPLEVTEGVAYPCSVYVYDNDIAGRFRLCFISDGGNLYPENYSADQTSWQHLGYTWIAPPGATWVVVQLRMYDISASWDGNATVYVDDVVFVDTTTTNPELTIYDIQFNNSVPGAACYDSPYLGQTVPITGTVTAIEQGANPNYYIQDCAYPLWNGIYVYDNTHTLSLGQNVTVTGTVSEYFGMTELGSVSNLVINSSGAAICTTTVTSDDIPPACDPGSEVYEGMLVRLDNVTCVVGPDGNGVGYLKSPGAADSCAFDDELHVDGTDHPVAFVTGQTYDYVIGVVQYAYDEYKINPRFGSDVAEQAAQEPVIADIARLPSGTVYDDDNVTVSAAITDDGTVTRDSLYIETVALAFAPVAHDSIVGDTYWYTIGVNDSGTTVNYYLVAIDNQDMRTQSSTYSYQCTSHPQGFAYLPGDANMFNGAWPPVVIGSDVTYLVNFFRGISSNPACLIGGFYCSADINGDCSVIGSDVTRLVNYFRGSGSVSFCEDYPSMWPTPDDLPEEAPSGWPNCGSPVTAGAKVLPGAAK